MAQNFISCDRDQVLLLPPDLREWLPASHLARFVIETVDQLDLDAMYADYRLDGRGRPAHDPAMMVALLLYAYATGVTSSRQIERRCVEDVAFRVISADRQPDHCTISRFLIRHRVQIEGLFLQVLGLCRRAGMVKVGTVAVDSTKLAANASLGQNRTLAGLEAEAARIIAEAVHTDQVENERYGEQRGDELPQDLADPRTRKARINELLEQARQELADAEAARAETVAQHTEHLARTGKRKPGRPPKTENKLNHRDQQSLLAKKYNLTDRDSGIVRHRGMLIQGYNVQAVASEDQVILATSVSGVSSDGGQLQPMIELAAKHLKELAVQDRIEVALADSGYWHTRQVQSLRARGIRALIPPANHNNPGPRASPEITRMRAELTDPDTAQHYRQRQHIIEPVFARTKHHRQITRVLRRTKAAVQTEIDLIATTHNLLKLHRALQPA